MTIPRRPRLLDLFCGAGGCSAGYHAAGFDVLGVDLASQPDYPFSFVQADALDYLRDHGRDFDVIHASPPCQAYSNCTPRNTRARGRRRPPVDLVGPTRDLLDQIGRPWVIENVVYAPLRGAVLLCGSMFGLDVRRHRLFESSVLLLAPGCNHAAQAARFKIPDQRQKTLATVVSVTGSLNYAGELDVRRAAMGIPWMGNRSLCQAIPPAYTAFLGKQILRTLPENPGNS